MWSQDDNDEAINWEAALAYAENATTSGYTDWRLPNIKELQSIADYSGVFPAMDTSVFNLTELTNIKGQTDYPFYWSSTSNPIQGTEDVEEGGTIYAWFLASGYNTDMDGNDLHGAGSVCFDAKSEECTENLGIERYYNYVRLVRGGNVTETPDGDPSTVNPDRVVVFEDGDTGNGGGGGGTPPEPGDTLPGGDPVDTPTGDDGGPDFFPWRRISCNCRYNRDCGKSGSNNRSPPAPSASELVANFAAYDFVITETQAQALFRYT